MRLPARHLLAGTALLAAALTASLALASPPGVTHPIPGDPIPTAAGQVSGSLLPLRRAPHPREPLARAATGAALERRLHRRPHAAGVRAAAALAHNQPLFR